MAGPLHLKIFLSSPGDVADERQAIVRLIKDELPYDELIRGHATFDVLAWDDRAQRVALLAGLSGQASVDQALGTPQRVRPDGGRRPDPPRHAAGRPPAEGRRHPLPFRHRVGALERARGPEAGPDLPRPGRTDARPWQAGRA